MLYKSLLETDSFLELSSLNPDTQYTCTYMQTHSHKCMRAWSDSVLYICTCCSKCENVVDQWVQESQYHFCERCDCQWQRRNTTTIKVNELIRFIVRLFEVSSFSQLKAEQSLQYALLPDFPVRWPRL